MNFSVICSDFGVGAHPSCAYFSNSAANLFLWTLKIRFKETGLWAQFLLKTKLTSCTYPHAPVEYNWRDSSVKHFSRHDSTLIMATKINTSSSFLTVNNLRAPKIGNTDTKTKRGFREGVTKLIQLFGPILLQVLTLKYCSRQIWPV